MKALVVYETKYGNTEKIAVALSDGLKSGGLATDCVKVQDLDVAKVDQCDFLAVGGPTHAFGISGEIKNFLKKLEKVKLRGKKAFAFDTKFKRRLYGSAAGKIEDKLKEMQFEIVMAHSSAIVGKTKGPLEENAEEKFRQIGIEIAKQILSPTK